MDGGRAKQNVVYTYSGILFSLKKEGKAGTCYHMDETYIKCNRPSHKRTNTIWFHLYEVLTVVKWIDINSRMVGARG
jgi:hypothetical protein